MKAVIFDLYETLVTENYSEWHAPRPTLAERLGIGEELCQQEWSRLYRDRMTGKLADFPSVVRQICHTAQISPPEEEITRLAQERREAKTRPFVRCEHAVVEMLDQLRGQGYKLGLVTNSTAEEMAAWDASPLAARIETAVFSHQVGLMKPEAGIYHLACEHLGVAPAAAVFVGDGGSDELRGARSAGLSPIWATWFIERWPWDWVGTVAKTAGAFPRCREVVEVLQRVQEMS